MNAIAHPNQITVMINRAMAALDKARTHAEVLDVLIQMDAAHGIAKASARFAKAKKAHDDFIAKCHQAIADTIEARAKAQCRLADEYDGALERGEVANQSEGLRRKRLKTCDSQVRPTSVEIGLTHQQIFDARQVRNMERSDPGIVRRLLDEQLAAGKIPRFGQETLRALGKAARHSNYCPRKPNKRQPEIDARNDKIVAFADQGLTAKQIATEVNLVERNVHQVLEHERIRRDAQIEAAIDASTLSMSAQEKLEAAIRQHKRQLDMQFERRVLSEIEKRVNEMVLPTYNKTYAEWQDVIERRGRGGVMDKATFNKIVSCLHADSRLSASEQKLNEAFHAFHKLEHLLVKDPEPAVIRPLPKTYEEMMALKKSVSEARKQNRQAMRAR